MQADPYLAPEALKNPQGWNRYAYVAGDPVNFNDPTGLSPAASVFSSCIYEEGLGWICLDPSGPELGGDLLQPEWGGETGVIIRGGMPEWRRYIAVRDTIHGLVKSLSTNFTPAILDCIAGIESWWNPNAVNVHRTRFGLFQFNKESWDYYQSYIQDPAVRKPWSQASDPEASTFVAIVALEVRVGEYLKNHPNPSLEAAVFHAVHYFGEGVLDMPYGDYVMKCARVIETDFAAAVAVIREYHSLPRP